MNREQFELAKAAVLVDANHRGEYFGQKKNKACALGGLYLATDPGHDWEYYRSLNLADVSRVIDEVYGLTWNDRVAIVEANDNAKSIRSRRPAVITVLERAIGEEGNE